MNGSATAAELLGGVGLFLLGTRLAAAGFGVAAGGILRRRFDGWTSDAPRAFATGVALSAILPGSGALPGSALGLARSGRLGTHRGARLVVGCGFGILFAALLALVDRGGWLPQAIGLAALGFGALFAELSPRRAAIGELAAGWGLVLLGVHLFGVGWEGVAEHGFLRAWLPVTIGIGVAGCALALALRSPAAVAALAVQATASGAIDGFLAASAIVGAGATIPFGTWRASRHGSEQDRTVATLHLMHGAIATGFGIALLVWGSDLPMLVQRAPAVAMLVFTLGLTLVPALLAWPFLGSLEHFLLARFEAPGASGDARAQTTIGAQTVPALAVERLALAVADSAETTRVLARKVLNGTGVSQFKRDELAQIVSRVEEEVARFRSALESVRWPGASVARVLYAERAARGYRAMCERLVTLGGLEGKDPAGPLGVPFLQARLAVLRFVEGGEERHEVLDQERASVESRLEELRIAMLYAFAADSLGVAEFDTCSRRLEDLRSLARLTADTRDALGQLVLHDAALFESWAQAEPQPEEGEGESEEELDVEEEYELDEVESPAEAPRPRVEAGRASR